MNWKKIRTLYPHQWVLVDAIKAHTSHSKRILDNIAVINNFTDSIKAIKAYSQIHKKTPQRELYVLHTDKEQPDITERAWFGIRCKLN